MKSEKSEYTPSQSTIGSGETIELSTRFGHLSRGKAWGKYYANRKRPVPRDDFQWVDKSGGTVYLSGPGYYIVGSNDGFSRSAKAEFYLGLSEPLAAAIQEAQQIVSSASGVVGLAASIVDNGGGI